MVDDLGGRLVQAGLVTRELLTEVLGAAPPHEGAMVCQLAERGISEDGLAGYFVSEGFGPLMDRKDLLGAEGTATGRLPASMAVELVAVPIYDSPAGLVIAMAAPTDVHAVAELGRASRGRVLPTVARVTDLRDALRVIYPGGRASERPPPRESEPPVLELVNRKKTGYRGSTKGAERVGARAAVGPRLELEGSDSVVPLVRTKPVARTTPARIEAPSKFKKVITKNFERLKRQREAPRVAVGEGTARATWEGTAAGDKSGKLGTSRALVPPTGRAKSPAKSPGRRRRTKTLPPPPPRAKAPPAPEVEARPPATARPPEVEAPPPAPSRPPEVESRPPAPARPPEVEARPPAPARPPEVEARPPAPARAPVPEAEARAPAEATPHRVEPAPSEPAESALPPEAPVTPAAAARPSPAGAPAAAAPRPRSIIPAEHERWDLDAPENQIDASKLQRMRHVERAREPSLPEVGGSIAAIRASSDRDEVVRLACEAALTVSRAAVLLALRKSVLKGWGGAGASVSPDAIKNLWIPTSTPSVFRDVVRKREPYRGPPGTSAADGLFRAALGSRGGELVLQPVSVGGKLVAVLAADDLHHGAEGARRIEELARVTSEALERIIVARKKR